nr:DUF5667 domain-containing protein [Ornithinibacillus caprae]
MFGGVTHAFAEEDNDITLETETPAADEFGITITEDDTDIEDLEGEPVPEDPPIDEGTTAEEEVPFDEPGLIPGDFFYFVEIIAEKVQLALTFGDTAKAELMSKFANERIAEANELFSQGDTDGAIVLLNRALESQQLALDYVADEAETEGTTGSDEEDPIPEELEGITPEEDEVTEEDVDKAEEPVEDVREELQVQFSKNVTALLLAMEKVENPTAKAALAKNVEKAFARMENKLEKMRSIEEQLASDVIVDDDVEELRSVIESDQVEFDAGMDEIEEKDAEDNTAVGKKFQEKSTYVPSLAKQDTEMAQSVQQKAQEKATQGKQTSQEVRQNKQPETKPPVPNTNAKKEAKQENTNNQDTPANEKNKGNVDAPSQAANSKEKAKGKGNKE